MRTSTQKISIRQYFGICLEVLRSFSSESPVREQRTEIGMFLIPSMNLTMQQRRAVISTSKVTPFSILSWAS
jgi:hypothetical protein